MNLTLLKAFLVLLSLAQGAAQVSPSGGPGDYLEPDWQWAFMLRPGESQTLDGATLAFDAVAEDSRCPPDMLCYWPGEAILDLTLRTDQSHAFTLKVGGFDNVLETSDLLDDYRVKVLWLSQRGEYCAVFMAAKTP